MFSQCTVRQFLTSYAFNVQSGSSRPPMLSMYNQTVPNLKLSMYNRQFPTSHVLSVQSGSSRPPMFSMYNQVCSHHVPNVRSPLSPMWNTYMSLKHPANHPSPVLSPRLSNISMKLGTLVKHLRKKKTKKSATCPCTKIEYFH